MIDDDTQPSRLLNGHDSGVCESFRVTVQPLISYTSILSDVGN